MSAPRLPRHGANVLSILDRLVAWASDVNSVLRTPLGRIALRATACYLALFTPVVFSSLGFLGLPLHWYERLWRVPASAIGRVLGAPNTTLSVTEDFYQMALVLCFVIAAVIGTIVWTMIAKRD